VHSIQQRIKLYLSKNKYLPLISQEPSGDFEDKFFTVYLVGISNERSATRYTIEMNKYPKHWLEFNTDIHFTKTKYPSITKPA